MNLETYKQQLLSRISSLQQEEDALISVISASSYNQNNTISIYKQEVDNSLGSLSTIPKSFSNASKQTNNIFTLAKDLSERIEEVDTAISRCTQVAQYVQYLADLSECLGSIDKLIDAKDIEKCCDYICRLLKIPENLMSEEDAKKIQKGRKETLLMLNQKMEDEKTEYYKYYEVCGAVYEGIVQFANLQHKLILEETSDARINLIQLIKPAVDSENRAPHVEVYVKFLDCLSSHILSSFDILNNEGQYSVFIRLLLERADDIIEKIMSDYAEYRSLSNLELKCSDSKEIQPVFIDLVNEEISIFAHQYSLFENFIKSKLQPGLTTKIFMEYKFKFPTVQSTGLPQYTKFSRLIKSLLAQYSLFTQAYLTGVTKELLSIIQMMTNTESVVNAIDDLFFIFHRILNRSVLTNSASTTCTIFNVITLIVRDQLMPILTANKNSRPGNQNKVCLLMNTLDSVKNYISKLVSMIETTITKHFSDDDLAAISSGLSDLTNCGKQLESDLKLQFDNLVSNLSQSTEKLCDPFLNSQFVNDVSVEIEIRLQDEFKNNYKKLFGSYEELLSKNNFEILLKKLSVFFTKRLESIIFRKKFESNGAILIKRIVNWLVKYFYEQKSFERLLDIVQFLSLAKIEDIQNYWGAKCNTDNPVKLTFNELKQVVKLHVGWESNDLSFLSPI